MTKLQKISKKLNIPEKEAERIIIYNHELNNLIPKSTLKEVELEIDMVSRKKIDKIAKALKVDKDAVIGHMLKNFIEATNEIT